jgi:hypothetical protein
VFRFLRDSGRCPSSDFLSDLTAQTEKKFKGSFDALSKVGASYHNHERFRPLTKEGGKPLWEFKEFDHRLYCFRLQTSATLVDVVLLNGWTKDKAGRSKEEDHKIKSAQTLLAEFLAEYPGGKIT